MRTLPLATPGLHSDTQEHHEDGLIVEHWDASEPIGPREEWVNSGRF